MAIQSLCACWVALPAAWDGGSDKHISTALTALIGGAVRRQTRSRTGSQGPGPRQGSGVEQKTCWTTDGEKEMRQLSRVWRFESGDGALESWSVGVCSVLAVHAEARSPAAICRYCYLEACAHRGPSWGRGAEAHAKREKEGVAPGPNRLRL